MAKDNKIKRILKKVADCLNDHWIWKTIILFIPSIYLPVVIKYAGVQTHLVNAKGKLTRLGIIITITIYVLALAVNILSNYKSKRDKEKDLERDKLHKKEIQDYKDEIQSYDNTLDVYIRLLNVIGNVCDVKLNSIYSYIDSAMKNKVFNKPFNETVYPENQLKTIARELKTCLSEITLPPVGNISVSMAYDFPCIGSQMRWIDQNEVAQCMQLNNLKRNEKTAFYRVYNGHSNFIFLNDKQKAAEKGEYVFDKKDERHHKIGSLICDEISVEDDDEKIARIILTISTYNYKFTNSEDKAVLANMSSMIEEVILQQFEKRIRIELALLFVKRQYNSK